MSKNKKPTIELICVLDRSGSMQDLKDEVINSYNHFIEEQKEKDKNTRVTLIIFDDKYEIVYEDKKITKVPELTSEVYYPRGMTSLLDAIGTAVNTSKAKEALVLIQTDGHENSSHEYNHRDIKDLIKEKEDQGWDFIFLGANIDAASVSTSFGLAAAKSVQYDATASGIQTAFASMSAKVTDYSIQKQQEYNIKDSND